MANSEKVDPLRRGVPIVGDDRGPTIEFIRQWNALRNLANFLFGSVENTGVTVGDYGQSGVVIPSFTVDAQGRLTAAADVGVDLDALLDAIGATRGAILYRGVSGWAILPPGASGHVLKSNGPGADPSYQAESGGGGGGGAWSFVETVSASAAASMDVSFPSGSDVVMLVGAFQPATDAVDLDGQVTTDNFSTVESGASDYRWSEGRLFPATGSTSTEQLEGDTADDAIRFGRNIDNANAKTHQFIAYVFTPRDANKNTSIKFDGTSFFGADSIRFRGYGEYLTPADTDGIRFAFSSGNISAADVHVYTLVTS